MTILTRRTVIGAGAAGVVAGIVGTAPDASAAPLRRRPPRRRHRKPKPKAKVVKAKPQLYSRARFARLRGTTFTVAAPTGTTAMVLSEVSDLSRAKAGADGCFVLTFTCAKAGPEQGISTFSRPGFAATPFFAVPSDAERRTYQVVVYRS